MAKTYPQLSSSFSIGETTIKNRFAVAPMDPGFDVAPDGSFTQMGVDYYARRAAGGFGLIYTGGMGIDTDFERFAPSILDNPAAFIRTGQEINARIAGRIPEKAMQPQLKRLFSCAVQPIPNRRSKPIPTPFGTLISDAASRRTIGMPKLVDMSTHPVVKH